MTKVPVILVHDWADDPPMTTTYICGENVLDVETVYRAFKDLKLHKGRGTLGLAPLENGMGSKQVLKECSTDFIGQFFICCRYLLDYFADFVHYDNAYMHQFWFHLVDTLNEAAKLPHKFWSDQYLACTHAELFARAYNKTVLLMNRVILARSATLSEELVPRCQGLIELPSYEIGDFKSGLKPWQQFLSNGSPGCDIPPSALMFDGGIKEVEGTRSERKAPMGAVALIQRHTERARQLTQEHADSTGGTDADALMRDFEAYAPRPTKAYTFITGHTTIVQSTQISPTAQTTLSRNDGFFDPSMDVPGPTLWMLNEAAGNYVGELPVELPGANGRFQMLRVASSISHSDGLDMQTMVGKELLDDMFDDWKQS